MKTVVPKQHPLCRRRAWRLPILAALTLLLTAPAADAGVWTLNAFQDQTITSIVADPNDSQTLYASTFRDGGSRGVVKTTDGGAHWIDVNDGIELDGTVPHVETLAIDPNDSRTLYAGTTFGVFKSVDAAAHWSFASEDLDEIVGAIVIDPLDSQTLYAGIQSGPPVIYKSTDGGAHWSPSELGLPEAGSVLSLAIDPAHSNILYAGTQNDGVAKSIDGGASWTPINDGLPDSSVSPFPDYHSILVDPSAPDVVYTGTGVGIFKTTDGGASWFASSNGLDLSGGLAFLVLASPADGSDTIYTGYDEGAWVSFTGGDDWDTTGSIGSVYSLALPTGSNTIYAGTSRGIYTQELTGSSGGGGGGGCSASTQGSASSLPLLGALALCLAWRSAARARAAQHS